MALSARARMALSLAVRRMSTQSSSAAIGVRSSCDRLARKVSRIWLAASSATRDSSLPRRARSLASWVSALSSAQATRWATTSARSGLASAPVRSWAAAPPDDTSVSVPSTRSRPTSGRQSSVRGRMVRISGRFPSTAAISTRSCFSTAAIRTGFCVRSAIAIGLSLSSRLTLMGGVQSVVPE